MNLNKIIQPTLIVDLDKVKSNIARMVEKAKVNDCIFRPHFKTHQSAQIGDIFREYGVDKITVTSVEMAEYFANHGWKDITIAMPVNLREINQINTLATKITLHIIIDSEFTAHHIVNNLNSHVNVWIEIDNGYHRSGVLYNDFENINRIALTINSSKHAELLGIVSHFGNTYVQNSRADILKIYNDSITNLNNLRRNINSNDRNNILISIGDTPSCNLVDNFGEVDEIRPGNFVFYDLMQHVLGVCTETNIAVVLACPVISKNKSRQEIVLNAGAIHLSKESIVYQGNKTFGSTVRLNEMGWGNIVENAFIRSLSQEHAIIKTFDEFMNEVEIGDLLGVIPVHSCLTANLMGGYVSTDGDIIKMARFR